MPTIDEFRANLITFGERVQRVREHLKNEEATKVALVLPFIATLGYDDRDPTEVAAEHAADFSEKYRNRVDYAILRSMQPVIAIECKTLGNGKKDDRGQLKSYFNAAKSVKLGILTDGVKYEFFVDSNEANMMDDEPFLEVDFSEIAKAQISETELEGLYSITKDKFDPETVAENARRNITYRSMFDYLSAQFENPSIEFTRFLLKENNIKHIRANAIESYKSIAKSAFTDVFKSNVLRRFDITSNVPKTSPSSETAQSSPNFKQDSTVNVEESTDDAEREAIEIVKRRLAFLANGDINFFDHVSKLELREYAGKFVIFIKAERKGRIIDIMKAKNGIYRYVLFDGGDSTPVTDISLLDERLKNLFERRIADT